VLGDLGEGSGRAEHEVEEALIFGAQGLDGGEPGKAVFGRILIGGFHPPNIRQKVGVVNGFC
jgi:hypothetical protein